MATAHAEKVVKVTLVLSLEEAAFIAALTQNSLYERPEQEPEGERAMRESIFTAIKSMKAEAAGA